MESAFMQPATHQAILAWAQDELAAWSDYELHDDDLTEAIIAAAERSNSVFVFDVQGRTVRVRSKAGLFVAGQPRGCTHPYVNRAELYQDLFESALASFESDASFTFAIDVDDESAYWKDAPIFSYSKKVGSCNILIPDVDFLHNRFYQYDPGLADHTNFHAKANTAVFAGSTSGAHNISLNDLASDNVPRIRSARFFSNNPYVDFRLPNIVQCVDDRVVAALKTEGFGTRPMDWKQQLRNKFVISIDGNGATCSRVFISLCSNSVLLKYASPWILYYFKGLVPFTHFIPIHSDDEVEAIVREEILFPGKFNHIASASRRFAADLLGELEVRLYAGTVLEGYYRRFFHVS